YLPGQRSESVFLAIWYKELTPLAEEAPLNRTFWNTVLAAREAIAKKLEQLRMDGRIGSSLDAEVDLYVQEALYHTLMQLGDELRFVLMTSYARLHQASERTAQALETEMPGLWAAVTPSGYPKCARCWHHREDIGAYPNHPELCGRCVANVEGAGEQRDFA